MGVVGDGGPRGSIVVLSGGDGVGVVSVRVVGVVVRRGGLEAVVAHIS